MRKIYENGWAEYQVEATQTLCQQLQLWEGVGWFGKNGHSLGLNNKTRIQQ